jgi:hypothetical protein
MTRQANGRKNLAGRGSVGMSSYSSGLCRRFVGMWRWRKTDERELIPTGPPTCHLSFVLGLPHCFFDLGTKWFHLTNRRYELIVPNT